LFMHKKCCYASIFVAFGSLLAGLLLRPGLTLAQGLVDLEYEASWFSHDSDDTFGAVWGDVDNDGDLDLAVSNRDGPNKLYLNENSALLPDAGWSSNDADDSFGLAWGDVDNDGDLDLAVANVGAPNKLYLNENGVLNPDAGWLSMDTRDTYAVAWGDMNGDGWLDLAAANMTRPDSHNVVYLNDGQGMLQPTPAWVSNEADATFHVAWGDVNGDGDLDLAAANTEDGESKLYLNQGGTLETTASWSSGEANHSHSVAFGDVDGDGDLDLAVGNGDRPTGQQNKLYLNNGGVLQTAADIPWASAESDATESVAWGDVDGDGDLDLAAANSMSPNRVYLNTGGSLQTTATWFSDESDDTYSVAWGDVDGDGDLDLAVANYRQPNKLYLNHRNRLPAVQGWSSADNQRTLSVAWGDVNGDGDLDLAAGRGDNVKSALHTNTGGALQATPGLLTPATEASNSIAWGDVDNDGRLDLAVGNSQRYNGSLGEYVGDNRNTIYRNVGGAAPLQLYQTLPATDDTYSVAWGDVDGDGDLDLAVGNGHGAPNKLYLNDGQSLQLTPAWTSAETSTTYSLAWGDMDNDGDLDLAAAGSRWYEKKVNKHVGTATDQQERIYINIGGQLQPDPLLLDGEDDTYSVAWGDVDGDGDLDLAVSNDFAPTKIYLNDGRQLQPNPAWTSYNNPKIRSVAWGDVDNDGDLDLATGGDGPTNRNLLLYLNVNGALQPRPAWASLTNTTDAFSVAWGDVDGDGDLDLAAGIGLGRSGSLRYDQLYFNQGAWNASLPDNPTYARILSRPGSTDDAGFFSTPDIIRSAHISITYKLFASENGDVPTIFPEYSPDGGGQWLSATSDPNGGDGVTDLTASPTGITHTFIWDANADLIKNDNVTFRIRAQPNYTHSLILWPAQGGAQTFPFRVEAAPWFVQVVDEMTQTIEGAMVYQNGEALPDRTDRAGLLRLNNPPPDASLVALVPTREQTTTRAAHDGWAYRIYRTNLNLDALGKPHPDQVGASSGRQLVRVGRDDPLVLFNIVVSVEWDATEEYLADLEEAFRQGSAYLYDVTDGQMAFGHVAIYDKATHWADADFQISAKNVVRPYAFWGGVTSPDNAHTIRVGRLWDGASGSSGNWSEPNGYRTLIHEFGHYGLYLYDEYYFRRFDANGNFNEEIETFCTREAIRTQPSSTPGSTNASIMFYQYNTSELMDRNHNWGVNCEYTEQYRLNGAQSDWETVVAHYGGPEWHLNTPTTRGGIMAGPAEFPATMLPFPLVETYGGDSAGGLERALTVVKKQGGQPVANVLVALYTTSPEGYNIAIDQGLTDLNGKITVYGAEAGDRIRAAAFDGSMADSVLVDERTVYTLDLEQIGGTVAASSVGSQAPYLSMTPMSDGDELYIQVAGLTESSLGVDLSIIPGEGAGSPQLTYLAYSQTVTAYVATVSLSGVGLGTGRVQASGGPLLNRISSDYNLQQVNNFTDTSLFSEDGNFELYLSPDSLPIDFAYATVLPTGYVPGPLPDKVEVIGNAYEVRMSGAVTQLEKEGVLTMHYHPGVMDVYTPTAAIYYWDVVNTTWQKQGSTPREIDYAVSSVVTRTGIYALMGQSVVPQLTIDKSVAAARVPTWPGDPITYTITLTNNGAVDALGVRITDTLPAGVNGADLDRTVVISAGQQISFILTGTITAAGAPYDGWIVNTAYYSHTSGSGQASIDFRVAPIVYLPVIYND
jgi:uncharacterized repeat protein (TIGR01451 family)